MVHEFIYEFGGTKVPDGGSQEDDGRKTLQRGLRFSSIFDNSFVTFGPRLYNRLNHAHAQGQHLWTSPGPWLQVLQVVVRCSPSELKPGQRQIIIDELQEIKIMESTAI